MANLIFTPASHFLSGWANLAIVDATCRNHSEILPAMAAGLTDHVWGLDELLNGEQVVKQAA